MHKFPFEIMLIDLHKLILMNQIVIKYNEIQRTNFSLPSGRSWKTICATKNIIIAIDLIENC